jgi:uncharacterized protein
LSLHFQPKIEDLDRLLDERELLVQSRASTRSIDMEIERLRNEIEQTVIDGPKLHLSSGRYFDFTAPEQSDYNILDIANALSKICRFTGHCPTLYSVAQHSVHLSRIVPREDALAGLLHDAAEAFIGDVSNPLKAMLPDYRAIEERVERAIFASFGLPYPMPASVKHADLVMLKTEQRDIVGTSDRWAMLEGVEPMETRISAWTQAESREQFLRRYMELSRA